MGKRMRKVTCYRLQKYFRPQAVIDKKYIKLLKIQRKTEYLPKTSAASRTCHTPFADTTTSEF